MEFVCYVQYIQGFCQSRLSAADDDLFLAVHAQRQPDQLNDHMLDHHLVYQVISQCNSCLLYIMSAQTAQQTPHHSCYLPATV
jgi:hypothetical protein